LAAAYGLILASLPLYAFKDRANYANHIVRAAEIFNEFLSKGVLSTVFNEPLWWWLNHTLCSLFGFEVTFRLIIALPAAIVAYRTLQHNSGAWVWSVAFLLAPQAVKNHIVHLRECVAFSRFLIAWHSANGSWRWVLLLAVPLIHTSFFFAGLALVVAR